MGYVSSSCSKLGVSHCEQRSCPIFSLAKDRSYHSHQLDLRHRLAVCQVIVLHPLSSTFPPDDLASVLHLFWCARQRHFYVAIVIAKFRYVIPAPGESWQENAVDPRQKGPVRMNMPIASENLVLELYIFLLPIAGIRNL